MTVRQQMNSLAKIKAPLPPLQLFIIATLAALLGASIPMIIKTTVAQVQPLQFCWLRLSFASLSLLPFLFIKRPENIKLSEYRCMIVPCFGLTGNITFFALGIHAVTPTISQVMYLFVPILVCIGSIFLLKEQVKLQQKAGIVFGTLGVCFAIFSNMTIGGSVTGTVLLVAAVVSHSIYVISSRSLRNRFDPIYITAFSMMAACIILTILQSIFEHHDLTAITSRAWLGIAFVGICGGSIYYVIVQTIVQRGSAVASTSILYIQPALTWVVSSYVFAEPLTISLVLGGMLSVFGAFLVARST